MLHHFLSLSLNLKKLRYHQKMPLLLPPPPAIRVTKHLMLKKRERLLLSSLLSRRPSQQVPVQTGKLVSTAHAVQLQWVHVHGAAWLGPTVTCALVRSSVSEEHAVGVCREHAVSEEHAVGVSCWALVLLATNTPDNTQTPLLFDEQHNVYTTLSTSETALNFQLKCESWKKNDPENQKSRISREEGDFWN